MIAEVGDAAETAAAVVAQAVEVEAEFAACFEKYLIRLTKSYNGTMKKL
jgi:hypothetical protein